MIHDDHAVAEATARVEETSARAIEIACRHIAIHEPFANAPSDVGDRDLTDFARIGSARLVSREELLKMAERNLARFVAALRARAAIYPQLDAVRLSVLAHVALVIRISGVLDCKPLWTAIHNCRWDDAADELMLTKWPEKARNDGDRRRMLELARMMRTGDEPAQLVSA